jgi:hypothetical protein
MRIRTISGEPASPRCGGGSRRNGQNCPRCKRFGTFAPNSLVCDRCTGALPLIFVITITVRIGGDL